jgi:hypothetical protein
LTHRNWFWFYRPHEDILYYRNEDRIEAYVRSATCRVRSGQMYCRSHVVEAIPQPALTATVQELPGGQAVCGEIGPPLFLPKEPNLTFWELLRSFGGGWMWEYVTHEETDMSWLRDAMSNGSLLAVTDGSYDRGRANNVSRSGWILLCTVSRRTLWGSFFEISPKARAYRGELLGLVAIHTLALAAARFFHIECVSGKICCDNITALNQAKQVRQRVRVGIKHLDLHCTVRNLKCSTKMAFRYAHVQAHQDRITPWSQLSLEAQLNVICDKLANGVVTRYLSSCTRPLRIEQFLPMETAAIVLDSVKLTTDIGAEVRFCLGKEEALRFYTKPKEVTNGCNRGGLGWSTHRFHQVAWDSLDLALWSKPDMFQVWLSKQCIGICATWKNMAWIQDLLNDKCPNCLQPQETSQHLNQCPDKGRTLLFKEGVSNLVS